MLTIHNAYVYIYIYRTTDMCLTMIICLLIAYGLPGTKARGAHGPGTGPGPQQPGPWSLLHGSHGFHGPHAISVCMYIGLSIYIL